MSKTPNWIPIVSNLFIAVPELRYDLNFLQKLLDDDYITEETFTKLTQSRTLYRRIHGSLPKMAGKDLIQRLVIVAPELFTVSTVNFLRAFGLINESQGHALRLLVRATGATVGAPARRTLAERLLKLFGIGTSNEMIDLWRSMGYFSEEEAESLRLYLRNAHIVQETAASLRRAKSVFDALLLIRKNLLDEKMLASLVAMGYISPRTAYVYKQIFSIGTSYWRTWQGIRSAEALTERIWLMMAGVLNQDIIDFLLHEKYITPEQYRWLDLAVQGSRAVNDEILQNLTKRRYRVLAGEAPIKTFARATRTTDQEILDLLAESAKEIEQIIGGMDVSKPGAWTRAQQYKVTRGEIFRTMRRLWDGVGYLTIRGERQAAEAAVESVDMLQSRILKRFGAPYAEGQYWQAKAGVDNYISRQENVMDLSRRIYKNMDFWQGKIDQRINMSLIQGKSASEIARDVAQFIDPHAPGGVSYNATRLARTEINNAFHYNMIRNTREMPWITGYKWNLSGSHPRTDICNEYATEDRGLGAGVFKKASVPAKPHPQCFCYITTVVMDSAKFASSMKAGNFNRYLSLVEKGTSDNNDGLSSDLWESVGKQAAIAAAKYGGTLGAGTLFNLYGD